MDKSSWLGMAELKEALSLVGGRPIFEYERRAARAQYEALNGHKTELVVVDSVIMQVDFSSRLVEGIVPKRDTLHVFSSFFELGSPKALAGALARVAGEVMMAREHALMAELNEKLKEHWASVDEMRRGFKNLVDHIANDTRNEILVTPYARCPSPNDRASVLDLLQRRASAERRGGAGLDAKKIKEEVKPVLWDKDVDDEWLGLVIELFCAYPGRLDAEDVKLRLRKEDVIAIVYNEKEKER